MKRHDARPDIVLETSSKEILKVFSANGLGVALMPDMIAEAEVKRESLTRLNWAGDDLTIYSQVFVHKDKRITKAIEGLFRLIQAAD